MSTGPRLGCYTVASIWLNLQLITVKLIDKTHTYTHAYTITCMHIYYTYI